MFKTPPAESARAEVGHLWGLERGRTDRYTVIDRSIRGQHARKGDS